MPSFSLFLSGYPAHAGNQLALEERTISGEIFRIPLQTGENPAEAWRIKAFSLDRSKNPSMFRILGVDNSTGADGWLGFSDPFLESKPVLFSASAVNELLLVILSMSTALVVYLAPGLILRSELASRGRDLSFIWIPVPGFLLIVLLGIASWLGPHQLNPRFISRAGLWIVVMIACYQITRYRIVTVASKVESERCSSRSC